MKDYYRILEITPDATMRDVQQAYKDLSRKYHPDKNRSKGATQHFQEISEAYQVLGDYHRRREYDNRRDFTVDYVFNDPFSMFNDFHKHFSNTGMFDMMDFKIPELSKRQGNNGQTYSYSSSTITNMNSNNGISTRTVTQINNNGKEENYIENIVKDRNGNVIEHTKTHPTRRISNNQTKRLPSPRRSSTKHK